MCRCRMQDASDSSCSLNYAYSFNCLCGVDTCKFLSASLGTLGNPEMNSRTKWWNGWNGAQGMGGLVQGGAANI